MIDITEAMTTLAKERPVFHSEADFQHSLAWLVHQRLPEASIRLELPFQSGAKSLHLDIWASRQNGSVAVEVKYKPHILSVRLNDEQFSLKNHAAHAINRRYFIEDISRLEQIVFSRKDSVGYAILVSNDPGYWNIQRDESPIDADFRLHEGRTLQGTLSWSANASSKTKNGHEEPIQLTGKYTLHWEDYSALPTASYGQFRYLCVQVKP